MFRKTLLASAMLAALAGPAIANYQHGYIAYTEGRYTTAYLEFKASADAGDAAAQYMLGRLYQEGRGVDRDVVQALAWYDLAAANGSSEASYARGRLAPQMTSYQLQMAATLTEQWRDSTGTAQPSPTPTQEVYVPYSVRNLQLALNRLGYAAGPADGLIGPKTRAAIRAYQIDSGLPASGEPSVSLHEHLQASLGAGSEIPATPAGPSAALISEVQSELRLRGYAIPSVNGVLDAATVAAIKRYQTDASLTADGRVTDALLAQLRSGHSDPAADYRAQVKSVQTALNARGFDAGPADGALGPRTRAAIRAFQVESGIAASGEIDAALLASLGIGTTTPTEPPTGDVSATTIAAIEGELVRRGYAAGTIDGVMDAQARSAIAFYQRDAGLEITGQPSQALLDHLRASTLRNETETLSQVVWQIEGQLRAKGYRVGPVDGTLDRETAEGIADFQQDAGLKVDGRPSSRLLAALESAVVVGESGESDTNLLNGRQTWEVEARLKARGYDVGTLDTRADAKTYAAVRAYQQDEGLAITGRLDEALLARLQLSDAGQEQPQERELSETEQRLLLLKSLLDSFAPKVQ